MSDDRLDQILLVLGEVKGDVKGLTTEVRQHFVDDKVNFGKIDDDVNAIHKKFWFGSGVVAALSTLFTLWIKGH